MAYQRKAKTATSAEPVNTKRKYEVTADKFSGQVNNQKYSGKLGDILEMEPWEATLLKAFVKEAQQ